MFVIKVIVGFLSLFQSGYEDNIKFIEDHNSKNTSYEVGVNQFINTSYINGTTNETSHYIPLNYSLVNILSDKETPKQVDWRKEGAVSTVKNQLDCGSCWAFSASEAIEGEWFLKHNHLYNVSEQELVDCSRYLGNMGCSGGSMDMAFEYVVQNGLCLNQSYPYNATDGQCQNQTCTKKVHIDKYYDVPHNNEKQLERAVVKQPISVAIQANMRSFQLYKKGIYSDPDCGDQLDHGVLLVGYGYDPDLDMNYWIVKNSWGDNWGEQGYIRMVKGIENPEGQCGIAMDASYPTINIMDIV